MGPDMEVSLSFAKRKSEILLHHVEDDDTAAVLMQCVESNCAKSFPNSHNLQTQPGSTFTILHLCQNLVPALTT